MMVMMVSGAEQFPDIEKVESASDLNVVVHLVSNVWRSWCLV